MYVLPQARAYIGGDIDFAVTLFPEPDGDGDEAIVLEEKHRCSSHLSAIKGMIALGKYTCMHMHKQRHIYTYAINTHTRMPMPIQIQTPTHTRMNTQGSSRLM